MLASLLSWIYISFLCWTWGQLFFLFLKKLTHEEIPQLHFSVICLTGLAAITVPASILSLFLPLGGWWIQIFLLLPLIVLLINNKNIRFSLSGLKDRMGIHPASLLLLSACLLMILVMSSWTIVHPDTLGYHAQSIQWIEKYKAVPGLAHLHIRFGYPGLWFVDNALFASLFKTKGTTYLNSTVLVWFFIFMINRIDFNFFKESRKLKGLFWLFLLFISCWSYTQVRLTATSASPDFIAALFIWLIVYLIIEKNSYKKSLSTLWLSIAFLSAVGTTFKLSVAPIMIIGIYVVIILIQQMKFKQLIVLTILTACTIGPFVTRNVLSSGYLFFPSKMLDIVKVDWKYNPELTTAEKNYITAYGKKQGVDSKEEIDAVNAMRISEWLPEWWKQRSAADKTIIIGFLISFIASIFYLKKIKQHGTDFMVLFLSLIVALIFWFINAPDPRFGFGQIIGYSGLIISLIIGNNQINWNKKISVFILLLCFSLTVAYTGYRFKYFFEKDQWLTPLGIKESAYSRFNCDGIQISTPEKGNEFGITPVPCTDLNCDSFSPRSTHVEDGFRSKENP